MTTTATAALDLISRGWAVVPIGYKEKECFVPGWQDLRITPDDVPRYFNLAKQNIGALAGEPSSGRIDVDLDVPEAVTAGGLLLPPTDLIHGRASNPNSHRWYAAEGVVTYRKWQFAEHDRDKPSTLAELRANGRQTLVPPSVHPTGEPYRWEREGEPGKVSAAELTTLMGRVAAAALIARHWPSKGSRHDAGLALAGTLVRAGWADAEIDRFTSAVAISAYDEEYKKRENASATRQKVAEDKPATGRPSLINLLLDGARVVPVALDWLGVAAKTERAKTERARTERAEPDTQTARPWPKPLDDAAYYGVLGKIAREMEPYIEADSAALLVNLLVTAGAALGRNPYVHVGTQKHYANLYVVVVGETGDGKSDSSSPISALLADIGVDDKPIMWGGMSTGEGLLWQMRDERRGKKTDKKTGITEDVIIDEGVSDKRLLATETEWARVMTVMYRDGNTLSPVIRQLFDGGDVAYSSPKANPVVATGAHLGMIGHITPNELRRKMGEGEFYNGFMNRFMWTLTRRDRSLPDPPAYEGEIVQAHMKAWSDAIQAGQAIGRVTRDEEAREVWAEEYERLRKGDAQRPGLAAEVCARAHVLVIRMALIFAALDGSDVITAEHQDAALAIWEYTEACAVYLFGDQSGDPIAEVIADALTSRGQMTRTDISRLFNGHVEAGVLQMALDTLLSAGCARTWKEQTGGGPREMWEAL